MSRYTGPVTRISRRLGLMLFQNGKSKKKAFEKKNYKPGEHGKKHFAQISEYNKQLQEKQKVKALFEINEKQCKKYYTLATQSNEMTGVQFMKLLERRIDNTIYRAGFANTRRQARQIVSHGLLLLNGKKIKTPSLLVKAGDKFAIKEKSKSSKLFENTKKEKIKAPKWIKVELKDLNGEVLALPDKDDIEKIIQNQLITEYYSK